MATNRTRVLLAAEAARVKSIERIAQQMGTGGDCGW